LGVPREAAYASATILPYDDTDIPIAMHADNVACILYIFTKRGLVSAHDLPTGKLLFAHKVSRAHYHTGHYCLAIISSYSECRVGMHDE
jgi:hypothetical protein